MNFQLNPQYEAMTRMIRRAPDGRPLKTAMAVEFPLLSRRERRALQRGAQKLLKAKQLRAKS
jgi:hypothetical protein